PVVVLRPFNTYGPRQSARAVIPTVLAQVLSGAATIELGNLEPRRDLTYVEDTVEAFVLAAEAPCIEGQVIHFRQGLAVSIGELARMCLEVTGSTAGVVSTPERQRPDKSEVELLLCDASRARQLLGWVPRVSLREGVRRTADYLRRHLDSYSPKDYT